MSKADRRKKRQRYAKPSLPRVIGANDNIAVANDNMAPEFELSREPGVKETPNQRIFRQMMRRALDDRPQPSVSYDPSRLTDIQIKELRRAEEKLQSGDPRRMEAGKNAVLDIAKSIQSRTECHDRALHQKEFRALEELRGSEFAEPGRNEPPGRLRIASRDGLETLSQEKTSKATGEPIPPAITYIQYVAGLRYRTDYEAIDPERQLTPPILDPEKVKSAHGGDNWDSKRREIERRVFGIHLMICGVDVEPGERAAMPNLPAGHPAMRSIHALNEIAGKGMNLADMTTSGSVKERLREDLIFALDTCAIVYGLE